MVGEQGGGGGGQADNSYQALWIIALITFVSIVIWMTMGEQLKEAFLWLRRYQLIALDAVLSQFNITEVHAMAEWTRTATRNDLNLQNAKTLSELTGKYYSFLYAVFFLWYSWRIFLKNPLARYKKKYTLQSLAQQEQNNWPQIKSVIRFDLVEEDLDVGPWAMAMTPMQFAKKNKLITITLAPQESLFAKTKSAEFAVTLDETRAGRVFAAQLGRPWRGPDAMPTHRRAIFAVLIARGCRDSDKSKALVAQLAASAASNKLDVSGVDALIKKHFNNRKVQELCAIHAYELTLMISLMQFARQDGVVASADFLWTKPIDRRLWLTLNNVGRQTPGAEVGGLYNHWYHECELKLPMSMPVVEGAITALDIALKEVMYIPDDNERDEIMERARKEAEKDKVL
jgi:intracellular multiplication protein IcmP